MNRGVFGGTFDPPHIGHLILAEELCHELDLDVVHWVLTPKPPHKPDHLISEVEHREKMLQVCLQGHDNFVLSRVDLDRTPPHYAADTVAIFRDRYPEDELVYMIGEDSLRDLPEWVRPQEFLSYIDRLGVLSRPRVETNFRLLEAKISGITGKTRLVSEPLMQVSSSMIRDRIRTGRPYRFFLLPAVMEIIEEHHLYR